MFEYFPGNYVWNLSVVATLNNGGLIDEVDRACRPLRDAATRGEDAGTREFLDAWDLRSDSVLDEAVELYHAAWRNSDATIEALELDAIGVVPWWPEGRNEITLLRAIVHQTTETHRHAGHADIVRELIDGDAGLRPDNSNLWTGDGDDYWTAYCVRLEDAARAMR